MQSTFKNKRPPFIDLNDLIIYDEGGIIALNKPPNLCSEVPWPRVFTIASGAHHLKHDDCSTPPVLAHRLDRFTSGVILLTRDAKIGKGLKQAFKERTICKEYLALVDGSPPCDYGHIEAPIGTVENSYLRRIDDINGKSAFTDYEVLQLSSSFNVSLLRMRPKTGRTHQLRLHAATCLDSPMLGDKDYHPIYHANLPGNIPDAFAAKTIPSTINEKMQGQMLHAHSITFTHPGTGKETRIEAPLPKARLEIWQQLGFDISQ